ncbi:transmembrane protein 254 isoform X3 [Oryctolagus cuniculus]|uniref:transmembrane protein 254 isoform X3 n=1 Tax=Oryctolagus cuniculus TaxID=9986 RepID=UPI00387A1BC1
MAMAMAMAAGNAAYFQRGSVFWLAVITLSFGYYTWVVLWPQSIPYESLGLLGSFTQYLVDHHHTLLHNGYWFAWMIHVAESLYAMVLCNSLLIMCLGKQQWMAQVLGLQPRGRPKRSSGPGFSLSPPQPLWLFEE